MDLTELGLGHIEINGKLEGGPIPNRQVVADMLDDAKNAELLYRCKNLDDDDFATVIHTNGERAVLVKLRSLALAGDTSAAKLYLDVVRQAKLRRAGKQAPRDDGSKASHGLQQQRRKTASQDESSE